MDPRHEATSPGPRFAPRPAHARRCAPRRPGPRANTVTASQARAARRREARRDEQAVAAWLRELSAAALTRSSASQRRFASLRRG